MTILAADNRRFTAVEIAQPIEVMVIDSGSSDDGVAAESYFLVTALEQSNLASNPADSQSQEDSPNRGRFRADVSYLDDGASKPFAVSTHPLVVVADAAADLDHHDRAVSELCPSRWKAVGVRRRWVGKPNSPDLATSRPRTRPVGGAGEQRRDAVSNRVGEHASSDAGAVRRSAARGS